MSSLGAAINTIPFITKGIVYRNDFSDSGSLIVGQQIQITSGSFSTDGDILTIQGFSTGASTMEVLLNLSGSPIPITSATRIGVRFKTGSGIAGNIQINMYSTNNLASLGGFTTSNFLFYSGSAFGFGFPTIDKFGFQINSINSGTTGFGFIDFIMVYNDELPFNSITNKGSYELKRRVIEHAAPMREQGIIQNLGSSSPIIDLDGIFINDSSFTAQNYRDKLISLWSEGTYQYLNTDFINGKFIPEDIAITQLAGVPNYYQFTLKLRQYSVISATAQNYNLS